MYVVLRKKGYLKTAKVALQDPHEAMEFLPGFAVLRGNIHTSGPAKDVKIGNEPAVSVRDSSPLNSKADVIRQAFSKEHDPKSVICFSIDDPPARADE